MTQAWESVRLEQVLKHRKEFITIDDTQTYKRCRAKVRAQGIILRDIVKGTEIRTKSQQVCRAGEFLVAEIDAKVGGFGFVPDNLEGAVVSSHYFLFQVQEDKLEKQFLDWFVRTLVFLEQVTAQGSTNYAAIRPRDVLGYSIPLPPLEEQRRIVARVESLAAQIAEARGLREQADNESMAFISSLHNQLTKDDSIVLNEIIELEEQKVDVILGKEYPQVGVRGFGQGLFARETLTANQTTYKNFNLLYEGALVLSQVKGWEGAVAVCSPDLVGKFVSPEFRTFRCKKDKAIPEYMAFLVSTPWFWTKLKDITRGVGARRERTRPEQFLRMVLSMPSLEQQEYALPFFRGMKELKKTHADTALELNALLPSVLSKAFAGEL